MDGDKLKAKIKARHLSVKDVSEELGIDQSTYYRKVATNGENFSVAQVKRLAELLHLTSEEAKEIFLQ